MRALLLALCFALTSCLGQTERTEPVQVVHIVCSPGPACPDGWHCAVLQGGAAPNECRPSCETDADCNDGFGCSSAIGWFPDGSVETLACERWEARGY